MTNKLKYIETQAPNKIEKLFIFIHGYGANGRDLLNLTPYFQQHIKNCHFIAPNAPYITGYPDSYYWFPIENFSEDHLKLGVDNAIPILTKFIDYCKKKYQLSNDKIILLGFSQGSLLSIHYGLAQDKPFKAIFSFSGGALPQINNIIKNNTPVCMVHGLDDEVLDASHSQNTAKNLSKIKHPHQLKLIENLGHTINPAGLDFAINFLNSY